jgi:hypothetical protein
MFDMSLHAVKVRSEACRSEALFTDRLSYVSFHVASSPRHWLLHTIAFINYPFLSFAWDRQSTSGLPQLSMSAASRR